MSDTDTKSRADVVPFATYVPLSLKKALKVHAAQLERPLWEIVAEVLQAYLDQQPKGKHEKTK